MVTIYYCMTLVERIHRNKAGIHKNIVDSNRLLHNVSFHLDHCHLIIIKNCLHKKALRHHITKSIRGQLRIHFFRYLISLV